MYVCMYIGMYICICVCMYMYICICMCLCSYIYMYVFVYMCICLRQKKQACEPKSLRCWNNQRATDAQRASVWVQVICSSKFRHADAKALSNSAAHIPLLHSVIAGSANRSGFRGKGRNRNNRIRLGDNQLLPHL